MNSTYSIVQKHFGHVALSEAKPPGVINHRILKAEIVMPFDFTMVITINYFSVRIYIIY